MPTPVITTLQSPVQLGLISDTHGGIVDWAGVQPKIEELFDGVDAIVHCGDVGTPDVLERLATIAPVLALRGQDAPPAGEPELVDGTRILECGDSRIGVVFSLTEEPVGASADGGLAFPRTSATQAVEVLFGRPVDAVVFGGTHQPIVASSDGILFVNPGSPTLADLTTVGRMRVVDGVIDVQLLAVP